MWVVGGIWFCLCIFILRQKRPELASVWERKGLGMGRGRCTSQVWWMVMPSTRFLRRWGDVTSKLQTEDWPQVWGESLFVYKRKGRGDDGDSGEGKVFLRRFYFPCGISEVLSLSVMHNSLQPHGLQPTRLLCPWDFPGKNTGVGSYFLLQGIFPSQGSNPGLLYCRQILHQLNYVCG